MVKAGDVTRFVATNKLLSALLVLWVNLALQPCAIAAGEDHDCPHCPPAHDEGMSAHRGHHGEKEATQPCAAMQSDCCDELPSNVGPRDADKKVRDFADQPAVIAEQSAWLDTITTGRPVSATGPPAPVAASPPLHVLHCVYLK